MEQEAKSGEANDKRSSLPNGKVKEAKRKIPRKIPESPTWHEVSTDLNLMQAEDRFFVCSFTLLERFR